MKVLKTLVLVVVASLMVTACGNKKKDAKVEEGVKTEQQAEKPAETAVVDEATPSKVVENYLQDLKDGNFEKLKSYVGGEVAKQIDAQAEQFKANMDTYKQAQSMVTYKVTGEEVAADGKTAVVKFVATAAGQASPEASIPLAKQGGKWVIGGIAD